MDNIFNSIELVYTSILVYNIFEMRYQKCNSVPNGTNYLNIGKRECACSFADRKQTDLGSCQFCPNDQALILSSNELQKCALCRTTALLPCTISTPVTHIAISLSTQFLNGLSVRKDRHEGALFQNKLNTCFSGLRS